MKVTARTATAALLATGLFAFSSAAMATNGYFTHGVGTESKAMGGSGVGSSENMGGISVATNPALGVFADEKWQVGLSIFSPMRSYTASDSFAEGTQGAFTLSQGEYDSENEAFPIPYIAKNWKLANDNALSFVFYGRGGMNTEWDEDQFATFDPDGAGPAGPTPFPGVYGGGKAGVDLMQAFISLNYSAKIGDNFAWGIGPVMAVQLFEANGLTMFTPYTQTYADNFFPYFESAFGSCLQGGGDPQTCEPQAQGQAQMQAFGDVTKLTNNGHDTSTGFGFALGRGNQGGTRRRVGACRITLRLAGTPENRIEFSAK